MNRGERAIEGGLFACGLVSLLTTLGILFVLGLPTLGLLGEGSARLGPLLVGTLLTTLIAIAVALPLGLLGAIYLAEFAPPRVLRVLEPTLELLSGLPTVVLGYFALVLLTPTLQRVIPGLADFNALSPGIVMGIMIVPMIASLGARAIRAVPTSVREAAWGLGAGEIPTIAQVVLPSASSGLAAAVVLAISRAIGETMIVTIAAGREPRMTGDPRVPVETMTTAIVEVGLGGVSPDTLEYRVVFVIGACLFVLTCASNLVAQWLARRFARAVE
jgi:phosphate transport system permease protein